jgi:hypothetical protein
LAISRAWAGVTLPVEGVGVDVTSDPFLLQPPSAQASSVTAAKAIALRIPPAFIIGSIPPVELFRHPGHTLRRSVHAKLQNVGVVSK